MYRQVTRRMALKAHSDLTETNTHPQRGRDIELHRARAASPECPRCAELERSSGEMRSAMAALTGESRARAGAAFEAERARDRDVHRATPY